MRSPYRGLARAMGAAFTSIERDCGKAQSTLNRFIRRRKKVRMKRPTAKAMGQRFLVALGRAIHLTWPVLSAILAIQAALGLVIGFVEGWSVGDSLYFTFVTGLTIGYGDLVPRQAFARALAILIGFLGIFLTGLTAAIAVHAMRAALNAEHTD